MRVAAAQLLWFGLAGALFGAGLAISRMTDPAKVLAFLDVTGDWDPSLAFVLGGAVLGAAAGYRLVRRLLPRPVLGGEFPDPPADGRIDGGLVAGAALFGVGWGLAGLCPGPALTNLARLRVDVALFVVAMLAGMWVARALFGVDRGKSA